MRIQAANGIQYVRTHVDVTDPKLIALEAMLELQEELKDDITIQIVAFPQEGVLSYPNGKQLMENAVKLGADVVGAIPHFEFTREYSVESLNFIMELAAKYEKLVDVHCDETHEASGLGNTGCPHMRWRCLIRYSQSYNPCIPITNLCSTPGATPKDEPYTFVLIPW